MCVERAFGYLKGVWSILKKPMTHVHLQKIPSLIVVCCILHNVVIYRNDIFYEGLVLWDHNDEKHTEIKDRTPSEDKARSL